MARNRMAGIIENVEVIEAEHHKAAPPQEQMLFTGSTDWSPDQAESYIDYRIQLIDTEIARLRQQLDDLTAMRKRWLAVTGGRSKAAGNGYSNGHSNGGSNGTS
jgi:hypothetical protein